MAISGLEPEKLLAWKTKLTVKRSPQQPKVRHLSWIPLNTTKPKDKLMKNKIINNKKRGKVICKDKGTQKYKREGKKKGKNEKE